MAETPATEPEWLQAVATSFHPAIEEFENLADIALKNGFPFHSIRIAKRVVTEAGANAGRVLGWSISATTQKGWEYENTTLDDDGSFWLLFKNPYVFS